MSVFYAQEKNPKTFNANTNETLAPDSEMF